ncbi:MAG: hypothetical protein BGP25_05055 [Lysobacterales bacterium 63-13]|nr:MAG: hypothetical protein BGP25_05055 [Xanthomonadales bacterium 63-13]
MRAALDTPIQFFPSEAVVDETEKLSIHTADPSLLLVEQLHLRGHEVLLPACEMGTRRGHAEKARH